MMRACYQPAGPAARRFNDRKTALLRHFRRVDILTRGIAKGSGFRATMKDLSRFVASALAALCLLSGGASFNPTARAASAGTPNFVVNIGIEDVNGTPVTGNGADFEFCPLTIIVDVSIAEGQPDSPNTTIFLDSEYIGDGSNSEKRRRACHRRGRDV